MRKLWAVVIVTVVMLLFGSCVIDEHTSKEEIKLAAKEENQVGKEWRFMEPLPRNWLLTQGTRSSILSVKLNTGSWVGPAEMR